MKPYLSSVNHFAVVLTVCALLFASISIVSYASTAGNALGHRPARTGSTYWGIGGSSKTILDASSPAIHPFNAPSLGVELTSASNSPCLGSEMQSTNVNSLVEIAVVNNEFQQLAAGENYTLQSFGIQAGKTCSPMLMFDNANGDSIQVIFSPNDSIIKMIYSPPSTVIHYACSPSCAIWSGYESYRCQTSGSQCYAVAMQSAQGIFNVPPATIPSQYEDSSCCVTSNWVGIGDVQGATDGHLLQGGVDVNAAHETSETCNPNGSCYGTPAFWDECIGCTNQNTNYWSSTCLYVNYGDNVNVTASRGSFVIGGITYTAKLTYGDNDPSSTCAIIWLFKGTGTNFNAYWAMYILESVYYGGCSYSTSGYSNLCQITQFNNNPVVYTAENYYSVGGWSGFNTAPSGYAWSAVPHYLYQGTQNTNITVNSNNQFTQTWITSQQK